MRLQRHTAPKQLRMQSQSGSPSHATDSGLFIQKFYQVPDILDENVWPRLDVRTFALFLMTCKVLLTRWAPNALISSSFGARGKAKQYLQKQYWYTLCRFQIVTRCAYTHTVFPSMLHNSIKAYANLWLDHLNHQGAGAQGHQSEKKMCVNVRPSLTSYVQGKTLTEDEFEELSASAIETRLTMPVTQFFFIFLDQELTFHMDKQQTRTKHLQVQLTLDKNIILSEQLKFQFDECLRELNRATDLKAYFQEQLALGGLMPGAFCNRVVQPGLCAMRTWKNGAVLLLEQDHGAQHEHGGVCVITPHFCMQCEQTAIQAHKQDNEMVCQTCHSPTTPSDPNVVRIYVQVCW